MHEQTSLGWRRDCTSAPFLMFHIATFSRAAVMSSLPVRSYTTLQLLQMTPKLAACSYRR
jgi:hypothetical protein